MMVDSARVVESSMRHAGVPSQVKHTPQSKRQRAGFSRKAARKPVPPAHRDRRRRGAGLQDLRVATRLTAPRAPPARSSTATAAA